jgi:pimeloyl-ACP methyl ester carboxylesterase
MEQFSMVEYGALQATGAVVPLIPRGRGQHVLVLPGFTGTDRSTQPLRQFLRDRDFHVHAWRLGANTGPHRHIVDGMRRRLDDLCERYDEPMTVVGWSLGGVYARELARAKPEAVRQVITLGSPFRLRPGDRSSAQLLYDMLAPRVDPFPDRHLPEHERPPVPVPVTAIYTRTDGVVRWHTCIESSGPRRENIRVVGTHNGLGFNLGAIVAIGDRLNQPDGTWTPFRPTPLTRHLFRRPQYWEHVR